MAIVARAEESPMNAINGESAYSNWTKHPDLSSIKCAPNSLKQILIKAHNSFGHITIVSGYRSHSYNRRVGGVKNSYHIKCMAADILVKGKSKSQMLAYFRKQSGIGGVGLYSHKPFIHIDVGPKREWYWHGKRRKKR